MLIVVEGCDRTGKTSLCRRLVTELGGFYVHFGPPTLDDPVEEYLAPLARYVPGHDQHLIVDRHYLGETVWPSFFKRKTKMTDSTQAQIEGFLERRGACCVLAIREPRSLNQACVDGDEPTGDKAWLVQVVFQSHAAHSRLPWIEYEHGKPGDYEHVVMNAREREAFAARSF